MSKNLHILIIGFAMLLPVLVPAQDGRYSQYFNNPVYLSPALAGNGIEYIRVTGIYRTQWMGMGTPFTTQGFAVDKVVNRVGIGGFINRQSVGDNGIRTLNIAGNLSYNFQLGREKINSVTAGVQVGIINKSFDPSKMTFDNQYDPDGGYDPNMSSGEIFTTTSVSRPDINAGLMYQRGWGRSDIRFKPFAGISFSHINRPNETFIIDGNKAPIKTSIYAGAGIAVNDRTEICPSTMILSQDQFKETTFGASVKYSLDKNNAIHFGIYNRMDDAVIAYAGYQLNQVMLGMSYDANTSELSNSGKGINAFEISLSWSPLPRKKKEKEPDPEDERTDEIFMPVLPLEFPIGTLPEMELAIRNLEEIPAPVQRAVEPQPATPEEPAPVAVKETPKPAVVIAVAPVVEAVVTDSDHDGISNDKDDCPYIKGSAATRGCPDSDGDGMHDLADKCPMEAGAPAAGGCPEVAVTTAATQTMVKQFNNVLFDPGSAALNTPDIFDIIERAIEMLYRDKTATAILSGHTDSEGDALSNMGLSEARTLAVKKYMVDMGIDPGRITTVAYGENMPLENSTGTEGKRLNRRVEINIVKP
jgi:type IX secretion system PorP/SprF family membrane protein